jgi:hypothetical protein
MGEIGVHASTPPKRSLGGAPLLRIALKQSATRVVSQKFIEEQPQILRLILAQNAPKFAQDDSVFVMQTSVASGASVSA